MASPKVIENALPDTLPADFADWDEQGAAQAQPSESRIPEPARQARTAPQAQTRNTAAQTAAAPGQARPYRREEDRPQPSRREAERRVSKADHAPGHSGKTLKISLIAAGGVVALSLAAATVHFVGARKQGTAVQQQQQSATAPVPAPEPSAIGKPSLSRPVQPTAAQDQQSGNQQPGSQQAGSQQAATTQVSPNAMVSQLNAPSRISPNQFASSGGNAPSGNIGMRLGGAGGNAMHGAVPGNAYSVKFAAPNVVSVSRGVTQGMLVHQTIPDYPMIAKEAMVQGTVVLQARISKTGMVEDVKAISGPEMLRQAAVNAVKHWRYRPYLLDNQPVEMDTTVDVVFSLGGQ